ncbi:MAG: hypothetical protein ACW98F_01020 [Candidatus Hodarchaeales archaeon]|jgi:hypothetical protein
MASALELEIETRDAKQVIESSGGKITFHPDDRGFALITAKKVDSDTAKLVRKFQNVFSIED